MNDEPIILEGYKAARFAADLNTGRVRPGNKKIRNWVGRWDLGTVVFRW